ncbi:MAG: phosphoribosyltransferase [Nanoarchaeota archaeon]|nr:phosphoribosyltransferase [Nanoarchaeota archaeon]
MKTRIINPREEYSTTRIVEEGLAPLFRKFEQEFRKYTAERLGFERRYNTANFNQYVGYLERACHAAETLSSQYDLGLGVAKKGMWLSYVFSLYGLTAHDLLVARTGPVTRAGLPLTPLYSTDVPDKKILIFDNDLVTGKTVEAVAEKMIKAGAEKTDLLLIYGNTRLTPQFLEQVSPTLKARSKIVGITVDGEVVVNTHNQIPSIISQSWSLEKDFNPSRKHLTRLAEILGVKL